MGTILAPQKISAVELLTELCSGVLAGLLAQKLCEMINNDIKPPKVNTKTKVGKFFARENAANFLPWCIKLGLSETCKYCF